MMEPVWVGIEEAKRLAETATRAVQGVPVLLHGETGSGKEVLSRWIHDNSPSRRQGHFVPINTAAIPDSLWENELFGHEKEAFTGANAKSLGKFKRADKGTLFLDEIGDMPLAAQAKLLRVLEDHRVLPLGSDTETQVDVLVIAATNADLEGKIEEGNFRKDLYHRLNVIQIWIKPLRDRPEAIAPLVQAIIAAKADKLGREPRSFTEDALAYLRTLSLPGNVRELEKVVVRALLQDRSDGVDREEVERLLSERRVPHQPQHEPTADDTVGNPRDRLELGRFLTQCERYEAATPAFRAGTEALAKVLPTFRTPFSFDKIFQLPA
jgi:DNA-binding NtrC family response regulator